MHETRKAKRQQQGVDAAHIIDLTPTQESLIESEQHVSGRNDVVIGRFGTRQSMTKDERFCTLFLPQYLLSGQARALKYGEHGLGVRPVYVGPAVLIKRSPTKIRVWPWVAPLRQTRPPLDGPLAASSVIDQFHSCTPSCRSGPLHS